MASSVNDIQYMDALICKNIDFANNVKQDKPAFELAYLVKHCLPFSLKPWNSDKLLSDHFMRLWHITFLYTTAGQ